MRIEYDSNEIMRAVGREVDIVIRETALVALRTVVFATPVDTGRARGNWQVTLDGPETRQLETLDKNGGATVSRGTQIIRGSRRRSDTNFRRIYIQNNLPYIGPLNNGSSIQAAAGFVERAAQAAIDTTVARRQI